MQKQQNDVNRIADLVSNLKFDGSGLEGQEVDQKLVDWYDARFNMFVEDGCRSAINAYLRKLQSDACNELTKLTIMHLALNK